jgi:hypothetical protein
MRRILKEDIDINHFFAIFARNDLIPFLWPNNTIERIEQEYLNDNTAISNAIGKKLNSASTSAQSSPSEYIAERLSSTQIALKGIVLFLQLNQIVIKIVNIESR